MIWTSWNAPRASPGIPESSLRESATACRRRSWASSNSTRQGNVPDRLENADAIEQATRSTAKLPQGWQCVVPGHARW